MLQLQIGTYILAGITQYCPGSTNLLPYGSGIAAQTTRCFVARVVSHMLPELLIDFGSRVSLGGKLPLSVVNYVTKQRIHAYGAV